MITPHRAVPHAHWAVEGGVFVREFKEVVDEGSDDSESARGEELSDISRISYFSHFGMMVYGIGEGIWVVDYISVILLSGVD